MKVGEDGPHVVGIDKDSRDAIWAVDLSKVQGASIEDVIIKCRDGAADIPREWLVQIYPHETKSDN